jgi:hypothetical protein
VKHIWVRSFDLHGETHFNFTIVDDDVAPIRSVTETLTLAEAEEFVQAFADAKPPLLEVRDKR